MAATRDSWWLDLVCVGLAATVPLALVYAGVDRTAIRLAAGLPLVLFLPGYALVSALYPEAREDCDPPFTRETGEGIDKTMRTRVRGLTGVDRIAVAVGLSAAITPGVTVFHYAASGSFDAQGIAASLGVLTWAVVCIGLARRLRLPASHRFTVTVDWPAALFQRYFAASDRHMRPSSPFEASNGREVALNVLLVGALLVALSTATYAFTQPPPSEGFDELAVVTETDEGYVAGNYPDDLAGNDSVSVAVANQHDRPQAYVLNGTLEVVAANGTVVDRDVQLRRVVELDPRERTYVRHDPDPTLDGERLRLRYSLERPDGTADGDGDGDADDPHRSVRVWIRGADAGSESGTANGTVTASGTATVNETTPARTSTPDVTTTPGGRSTPDVTTTPDGTSTPEGTTNATATPSPTPTATEADGIDLGL
jgi:uncharacterized membrane protein